MELLRQAVGDSRPRLLTLDGYGHTSFGKNTCEERAETRYLVSLLRPPRGAGLQAGPAAACLDGPSQASAQQAVSTAVRLPLPSMPRLTAFA
jgi:hypothetical protein